MNQKGFANIILVVVIVILVGAVGYFAFVKKSEPIAQQPTPTPTQTKTPVSPTPTPAPANSTANWKSDAENTVSVFIENINTPGYGNNINIAFTKLTSSAQAIVKAHSPNLNLDGLASGLAYFVGVQESPDKGTSIISSEKLNDATVKVSTKWNYSGMSNPITKTFTLILEGGQWKIDKVQ